jgi:hypothetical protein
MFFPRCENFTQDFDAKLSGGLLPRRSGRRESEKPSESPTMNGSQVKNS